MVGTMEASQQIEDSTVAAFRHSAGGTFPIGGSSDGPQTLIREGASGGYPGTPLVSTEHWRLATIRAEEGRLKMVTLKSKDKQKSSTS